MAWLFGLPFLLGILLFVAGGLIAAKHVASNWGSLGRRERLHVVTVCLAFIVFIAGLLNFILFWMISLAIGGDADKIENGRYFVASRRSFTEVSEGVWTYSYYHVRSIWISHPLTMLAAIVMGYSRRLWGLHDALLNLCMGPDGTIFLNGATANFDDVIAAAESAKANRVPIYLKADYSSDAPPDAAVKLHFELAARQIVFLDEGQSAETSSSAANTQ